MRVKAVVWAQGIRDGLEHCECCGGLSHGVRIKSGASSETGNGTAKTCRHPSDHCAHMTIALQSDLSPPLFFFLPQREAQQRERENLLHFPLADLCAGATP